MASRTRRAHGQSCVQRAALPQETLFQALRKTEMVSESLDLTVGSRFPEGPYSHLSTFTADISEHSPVLPTYLHSALRIHRRFGHALVTNPDPPLPSENLATCSGNFGLIIWPAVGCCFCARHLPHSSFLSLPLG